MIGKTSQRYLPFGYKLLLSYCLFIIIPILLLGYAANSIFVSSAREQTRSNIQGTLNQMKDNITYKMETTTRISDLLYEDVKLAVHLKRNQEGWSGYETTTDYLLPKYQSLIESSNDGLWLSIYTRNNSLPEIYKVYVGQDPLTVADRLFDMYHMDRIIYRDWYLNFPKEVYRETMQWKQIEDDVRYERISLLRRLVDSSSADLNELGFIRISIRLSELFESVDFQKIGNGATIFAVDGSGRISWLSGDEDRLEGTAWDRGAEQDHLVIEEPIPGLDWRIVALVPSGFTDRDTSRIQLATVTIFVLCFVVLFFASLYISRHYAKYVSEIELVLDSFQEGAFHKRIHFRGRDEFSRIAAALNKMGQNIGDLIQEVYLTNIKKKEAELEALQAQINPHFLSNTLSSISRMAQFGDVDKLQRMVMDLAKFYRLTLNEGRTIISVYKELEQVKTYIDIQATKVQDRLTVQYDIDPDILKYDTIKLILQPIVENVLEHAWRGDRIHIRIMGFLEADAIVFTVIDDGFGIRPEVVRKILNPLASEQIGFGMRSVDQRIKLHFGKEYGLSIYSRPGIGTVVRLVIPAQRQ